MVIDPKNYVLGLTAAPHFITVNLGDAAAFNQIRSLRLSVPNGVQHLEIVMRDGRSRYPIKLDHAGECEVCLRPTDARMAGHLSQGQYTNCATHGRRLIRLSNLLRTTRSQRVEFDEASEALRIWAEAFKNPKRYVLHVRKGGDNIAINLGDPDAFSRFLSVRLEVVGTKQVVSVVPRDPRSGIPEAPISFEHVPYEELAILSANVTTVAGHPVEYDDARELLEQWVTRFNRRTREFSQFELVIPRPGKSALRIDLGGDSDNVGALSIHALEVLQFVDRSNRSTVTARHYGICPICGERAEYAGIHQQKGSFRKACASNCGCSGIVSNLVFEKATGWPIDHCDAIAVLDGWAEEWVRLVHKTPHAV